MDDYDFDDFWNRLEIFDVKNLKDLASDAGKYIKEHGTNSEIIESFFSWALYPYYCPRGIDWDGMTTNAGHIIYRLSDFLQEEKRKNIAIYPNDKGSLMIEMYERSVCWDSLEDWRKKWKKYYPIIPDFIKRLPSGFEFLEK